MFTIFFHPSEDEIMDKLPEKYRVPFLNTVEKLRSDPIRCSKALKGPWKGYHSARYGKRRIVFRLDLTSCSVTICSEDRRGKIYGR
ncbi:hypothetical protein TNIN_349141 [Trichonephila inaurata madagascariensis]|uniref:Uncharacterized protein n=1 Tax=Trichonephila inaurata madagascariensis TaxID=2747483 RepID=A0A8X6XLE9_9ARAC|nr:hypothetical protein TNIN_349141 [Trichonephila inaurata madagascariensis]